MSIQGFRPGSITRVRMKNFLTFDECEVSPGPKLNIVLGPNGTGKSSMTHAICLACGGSTGDVGRSNDLSKFVKQGKEEEESFAEVDIMSKNNTTITIRRVINAQNKGSKWFLNGQSSTQAAIKDLVASLSIDVDNLCSFMPQDKVGKFTQFTPREILHNTLKAIKPVSGQKSLHEEQMELSSIELNKGDLQRNLAAKQNAHAILNQEFESLRTEMDRLNRRKLLKEHAELYEIKALKIKADAITERQEATQAALDVANNKLATEREMLAPLEAKERDLKREQAKRQKTNESTQNKLKSAQVKLKSDKDNLQEVLDMRIIEASKEVESVDMIHHENLQRLNKLRGEEAQFRRQKDTAEEQCEKIRARLTEIDISINTDEVKVNDIQESSQELSHRAREKNELILTMTKSIAELQDFKQIYKNKLKSAGNQRDTVEAMEWMDKNVERLLSTGRLHEEVYGPVSMYCTVKDPACAVILEKVVPQYKLLSFIALNDNDANVLKAELRTRLKLKVDVITLKNQTAQNAPFSASTLDQYRTSIRLQGYLVDQVICPPIIRSFLCTMHGVHTVLWARNDGSPDLSSFFSRLSTESNSFSFFMHNTSTRNSLDIVHYSGKRSRYATPGQQPSISSIGVESYVNGLINSRDAGGDEDIADKKARLNSDISVAKNDLSKIESDLQRLRDQEQSIRHNIAEIRKEKTNLNKRLKLPQELNQKIERILHDITAVERTLHIDTDIEKKEKTAFYSKCMDAILANIESILSNSCDEMIDLDATNTISASLQDGLSESIRDVAQALRDAQSDITAAKAVVDEAKRNKDKAITERAKIEDKFKQLFVQYGGEDEFINTIYPKMMEKCPENSLGEVENRLVQINHELDSSVENPHLAERFEETRIQLDQMKQDLKVATEEFENADDTLKRRSQNWVTAVEAIQSKLNVSFGMYMEALSFQGQVQLVPKGTFDQYEMQMRVNFHTNSSLCDLSGTRHSGGERAVSTIMYLMALQDMTSAPFRVVDEINQGMDERNERLVFDRIVQSCCGDDQKPQYFLVSPKLLPGLRAMDNDDVTILLIWNGPGVKTKWQLPRILQEIRNRARLNGNELQLSNGAIGKRAVDDNEAYARKK
eukprot:gene6201-8539_t